MKKRHYKKKRFGPEEYDKIKELIGLANEDDLGGETIQQAKVLEGNLRNTFTLVESLHQVILQILFLWPAKDSDLYVT
jgi:DNA polymerase-3 subunit alpha